MKTDSLAFFMGWYRLKRNQQRFMERKVEGTNRGKKPF